MEQLLNQVRDWCQNEGVLCLEGSLVNSTNLIQVGDAYKLNDFLLLGKKCGVVQGKRI